MSVIQNTEQALEDYAGAANLLYSTGVADEDPSIILIRWALSFKLNWFASHHSVNASYLEVIGCILTRLMETRKIYRREYRFLDDYSKMHVEITHLLRDHPFRFYVKMHRGWSKGEWDNAFTRLKETGRFDYE